MLLAIAVLFITLGFAAGPFLWPDFGGFRYDRFPVEMTDPAIQPAGWAFAIWGPIYLWLVVSALFGLLRRGDDPDWGPMRPALMVSLAVGMAWLPVAQTNPALATVMIWAMLAAALVAFLLTPAQDAGWAAWPVGLYAGWLSAASCVGLGIVLQGYGLLAEPLVTQAMLGLALVIAVLVQLRRMIAPTYGLAVIWAFAGVAARNAERDNGIFALAISAALVMAVVTGWALLRTVRAKPWRAADASAV